MPFSIAMWLCDKSPEGITHTRYVLHRLFVQRHAMYIKVPGGSRTQFLTAANLGLVGCKVSNISSEKMILILLRFQHQLGVLSNSK